MRTILVNILFAITRMLASLPLCVHQWNARGIAYILEHVLKYRRTVIETNLKAALPHLPESERTRLIHEYYLGISDLITEFIWAIGKDGHKLEKKGFITIPDKGRTLLDSYDRHKGIMVLTAHFGNWEMMSSGFDITDKGGLFTKSDIRTTYRKLTNPFWEEFVLKARTFRKSLPEQSIESRQVLRYIARHRDSGYIYFFLVDQYPYSSPHPAGDFLGLPTNAIIAPAQLAERFSMPVVYCRSVRIARGRYEVSFEKISDDASATGAEEIMKRYFTLLETDIKRHPSNWLWSHKRWKNIKGFYPPKKKKK